MRCLQSAHFPFCRRVHRSSRLIYIRPFRACRTKLLLRVEVRREHVCHRSTRLHFMHASFGSPPNWTPQPPASPHASTRFVSSSALPSSTWDWQSPVSGVRRSDHYMSSSLLETQLAYPSPQCQGALLVSYGPIHCTSKPRIAAQAEAILTFRLYRTNQLIACPVLVRLENRYYTWESLTPSMRFPRSSIKTQAKM